MGIGSIVSSPKSYPWRLKNGHIEIYTDIRFDPVIKQLR